jgi:hypothetical protein
MSTENDTFEFLEEAVAAVAPDDVLYGIEVHETVYQTIKKDSGVRVGNGESQLAPLPGGGAIEEFDCLLSLVCFARVTGADKTDRVMARDQAMDIAKAVSMLFLTDPSMGGRVRDSRVLKARRGFDSIGSQPFAVCELQVVVNETGQQGEYRG